MMYQEEMVGHVLWTAAVIQLAKAIGTLMMLAVDGLLGWNILAMLG
jgi:hypothetical protein